MESGNFEAIFAEKTLDITFSVKRRKQTYLLSNGPSKDGF
jgi:hypothetical protein